MSAAQGGTLQVRLTQMDDLRNAIYARMVRKVGSRTYWDQWARDIAVIAQAHITRITALVDDPGTAASQQFDVFLDALRRNLNESITRDGGSIEMLAQHMITKPVFDALFEGYAFTDHNPVSQVMNRMVDALTAMHVDAEAESLEAFYESVRLRAAGIDNAEGKQKIITELYESFFKNAFPRAADAMGVVYTPIEIVDFILRSVDDVLKQEFNRSISDEGVHVLDPFTGTGTFIVRLLQSGLIDPADLARKYASELHANEILLLAYYIAAINIETTFHDLQAQAHGGWSPRRRIMSFDGIVLTDTFQLTEDGDLTDEVVFPTNNTRAEAQKALDIRVIVGNPPYSVGQTSGNDDNANVKYPTLDTRVRDTFAARTDATNKNSLYDSYMRAIRWASDRIGDEGVIGFVTNGGWIEGEHRRGCPQDSGRRVQRDLRLQPPRERTHGWDAPPEREGQRLRLGRPNHDRRLPPRPYDAARRPPRDDPLPRHRRLPHREGEARDRRRRQPRHRPVAPDRTERAWRLDQSARRGLPDLPPHPRRQGDRRHPGFFRQLQRWLADQP